MKSPRPFSLPVPLGRVPTWGATEIATYRAHVTDTKAWLARAEDPTGQALTLSPDVWTDLLHVLVGSVEAFNHARQTLRRADTSGKLKDAYELFVCRLRQAGLPVRWEQTRDRAIGHRRLGELAEARGDVVAALWHYDQAVKSWRDVGCRRQRDRLAGGAHAQVIDE